MLSGGSGRAAGAARGRAFTGGSEPSPDRIAPIGGRCGPFGTGRRVALRTVRDGPEGGAESGPGGGQPVTAARDFR
ncbi:hypothetical protein GCM10020229_18480 [Kitasatospora albolonga]